MTVAAGATVWATVQAAAGDVSGEAMQPYYNILPPMQCDDFIKISTFALAFSPGFP
jgi:hypothetical protein